MLGTAESHSSGALPQGAGAGATLGVVTQLWALGRAELWVWDAGRWWRGGQGSDLLMPSHMASPWFVFQRHHPGDCGHPHLQERLGESKDHESGAWELLVCQGDRTYESWWPQIQTRLCKCLTCRSRRCGHTGGGGPLS
jgi:hypothetical protein